MDRWSRVRLHSSSLRGGLSRRARNRSVSPSGSPDPWAAVRMFGFLVGTKGPGAEVVTRLGPFVTEMDFHILDMDPSFRMILGRPFIQALGTVISTVHQCLKFPYKGRVIKVSSKPAVREVDAMTDNSVPSSNQPLMSMLEAPSMYPGPSRSSINAAGRSKIITKKGWHIMMQMGYQPGKGLGTQLQGRTEAVKDCKMRPKVGLGYRPSRAKQQPRQPPT
ncbi:hypothetical protein Taro_055565 [Colocasia esculenta]|uniref:G-patch domain-containing protein n=1 Tax=Colocasia esculenta TaxID=4460 RepID=A0A843XTT2_COLES|nr:hypothetical protein [Colocasia esculenta]